MANSRRCLGKFIRRPFSLNYALQVLDMLKDSLQLAGFHPLRVTPAMIHNSAFQVEERLRTTFLHRVAAPLVGSRPAGSPATAEMTRGESRGKLGISGEDGSTGATICKDALQH